MPRGVLGKLRKSRHPNGACRGDMTHSRWSAQIGNIGTKQTKCCKLIIIASFSFRYEPFHKTTQLISYLSSCGKQEITKFTAVWLDTLGDCVSVLTQWQVVHEVTFSRGSVSKNGLTRRTYPSDGLRTGYRQVVLLMQLAMARKDLGTDAVSSQHDFKGRTW